MKRTVVFDTETESLNLRLSRPWQLSYVITDGWKLLEKHDYILDIPNFNISADAARITKFNWDKYKAKKEDPVPRLKQFQELMRDPDTTLVAHKRNRLRYLPVKKHLSRVRVCVELGLAKRWSDG